MRMDDDVSECVIGSDIHECDVGAFMSDVDELRMRCVCTVMQWNIRKAEIQFPDELVGLMESKPLQNGSARVYVHVCVHVTDQAESEWVLQSACVFPGAVQSKGLASDVCDSPAYSVTLRPHTPAPGSADTPPTHTKRHQVTLRRWSTVSHHLYLYYWLWYCYRSVYRLPYCPSFLPQDLKGNILVPPPKKKIFFYLTGQT